MHSWFGLTHDEIRHFGRDAGGMKETVEIVGWVLGIRGAIGVTGRVLSDSDRGLVHTVIDSPPTALYVVLAVVGAAPALWGEATRGTREQRV